MGLESMLGCCTFLSVLPLSSWRCAIVGVGRGGYFAEERAGMDGDTERRMEE